MSLETIQDCAALGRKVRELRRAQKVTQAQLSGLANTGIRFISDLENGKETCHIGKMLRVLETLGVDMLIRSPYDKE
jgi:y4mF family transcriptional regulator